MVEIETPELRVLWSGDMDTRSTPNTLGARPVVCDVLFLEGKYGGREHPPRAEEESRFVRKDQSIEDRGGVAMVPAFASGRGQDILRILHREAPHLEDHYDGMGTRVTLDWMEHPDFIREVAGLQKTWRCADVFRASPIGRKPSTPTTS